MIFSLDQDILEVALERTCFAFHKKKQAFKDKAWVALICS